MADRVTFWTRVTIGGVEYPPDDAPRGPCPGTNRLITPARDFGVCPVCGRYWPHFVGDDSGSVRLFAVPIHDNDMERAVLLFFESLFRLHDRALLRAAIANSDAPQICDAYEPADRPGYDACARCGWSSRIHDGLPRDRKARAWAAYLDSCRRSRLRSKAYLGRALPDVRR